jgi:hypothetical protein
MFQSRQFILSGYRRLLLGVGFIVCGAGMAQVKGNPSTVEAQAAEVIGTSDSAVLSMIRELTSWKERALHAESLLLKAGYKGLQDVPKAEAASTTTAGSVVGSLEDERTLVISLGRYNGALLGALVSVGGGVIAKVVESREMVSAALVDNSYKGKLVTLEGLPVKLAVR